MLILWDIMTGPRLSELLWDTGFTARKNKDVHNLDWALECY